MPTLLKLERKRKIYAVDCGQMNDCTIRLPSKDDKLSFN